jgi:hypothetical protein
VVLAMRVPVVNGRAGFSTSALGAGTHFITATHDGSSTSITRMQKVHQSGTSTKVSGWEASGFLALAAIVIPDGRGVPTGMVTFQEGTLVLAQKPLTRSGTVDFITSTLGAGGHTITAVYTSDPLFAASGGSITLSLPPAPSPVFLRPQRSSR